MLLASTMPAFDESLSVLVRENFSRRLALSKSERRGNLEENRCVWINGGNLSLVSEKRLRSLTVSARRTLLELKWLRRVSFFRRMTSVFMQKCRSTNLQYCLPLTHSLGFSNCTISSLTLAVLLTKQFKECRKCAHDDRKMQTESKFFGEF